MDSLFNPVWMSSSYAVREIDKLFAPANYGDYYFKESAIDARNPDNEADSLETAILGEFNRGEEIGYRAIRYYNKEPYFVIIKRGRLVESSCLQCHGAPEKAPLQMLETYSPNRSFNRQEGTFFSAISIRIPLASAYARAETTSDRLLLLMSIPLLILFILQYLIYKGIIGKPLVRLRDQANLISSDERHLGEQIAIPYGKEMAELTVSFNDLSTNLGRMKTNLEQIVAERTESLRITNETLEADITKRKVIEAELKREHAFVNSLVETAPAIIMVRDTSESIVSLNPFVSLVTGYTVEELRGKSWINTFVPPDLKPTIELVFSSAIVGEKTSSFTNPILCKDGSLRHIRWYHTKLEQGEIKAGQLLSIGFDVTLELQAAEEARLIETRLLQAQKEESMTTLAGGMAHDFNNILTGIIGYAELVIATQGDKSNVTGYMKTIINESMRAADITRQMLAYVGKTGYRRAELNLVELIRSALPLLSTTIDKQATLTTNLPESVSLVLADSNAITQLLLNLVVNSSESFQGAAGKVNIKLSEVIMDEQLISQLAVNTINSEGRFICIEVSDNGCGIPESNIGKLFDPFFTTKFFGRGLGLAAVAGIVRSLHGGVSVTSRLDSGTTIKVYLPIIE